MIKYLDRCCNDGISYERYLIVNAKAKSLQGQLLMVSILYNLALFHLSCSFHGKLARSLDWVGFPGAKVVGGATQMLASPVQF
jgi:hypothetical protein